MNRLRRCQQTVPRPLPAGLAAARSGALLAAVWVLTVGPAAAIAQPVPVAPRPDAGPVELPPGHPPLAASPTASSAPVDSAARRLPPGHPEVGPPSPARAPHPSTMPQGRPDTVSVVRTLPSHVVEVLVVDADEQPLPGISIVLHTLRSLESGATSHQRRSALTDADGRHRFEALEASPHAAYRLSAARDQGRFSVEPFNLDGNHGVRVLLHVYHVTSSVEQALIATQAIVIVEAAEDAIAVHQVLTLFNFSKLAFVPERMVLPLPAGFRALASAETMGEFAVEPVEDVGVKLTGTVPPGRSTVRYQYQLPMAASGEQTLHIALPPRAVHVRVVSEGGPGMAMEVTGFPPTQRIRSPSGAHLLVAEQRLGPSQAVLGPVVVTLRGLPTPGPARWIALVLALGTMLGGAAAVVHWRRRGRFAEDSRNDLVEARDALLDEFERLELAHRARQLDEATYDRLRSALLDALACVIYRLDQSTAQQLEVRR